MGTEYIYNPSTFFCQLCMFTSQFINCAIDTVDIQDALESKQFMTESSIGYTIQLVKSIDIDSIDDFRAAEKVKVNI